MENQKNQTLFTRRRFIGTVMMSTAAGALLNSCNKSEPWQIGIYTRPWNQENYLVAFDNIAKAGFQYVGLMSHKGGRVLHQDTTLAEAAVIAKDAMSRGLSAH